MTSQHENPSDEPSSNAPSGAEGDEFWGGQRDWSGQVRRVTGRHERIGSRLRTGMQAVLDVGASSAARRHGDNTGATARPDVAPVEAPIERTSEGLTIGELAEPWDDPVQEPTMAMPLTEATVERPPAFDDHRAGAALARGFVAQSDAAPEPEPPVEPEPVPSAAAGAGGEAEWGDEWAPETHRVPPPRGGIDPLLAKIGGAAVVLTLLISFVLSLGNDSVDRVAGEAPVSTLGLLPDDVGARAESDAAADDEAETAAASETAETVEATSAVDSSGDGSAASAGSATSADTSDTTAGDSDAADEGDSAATADSSAAETVAADPAPTEQNCAVDYTVVEGDYWLRLADGAGVPTAELLEANAATLDTPIYPGENICLPAGSSTPPAPTTAPPAATASASSASAGSSSSASSASSSSASTTTQSQPAPTSPPTTQAPPPPPPTPATPASPSEVVQIIRDVWPDELEEKAIDIAWRESNHRPEVYNGWCCYGVFQMYYSVHQGWLAELGISSASDLYDAEANVRAAYTLYQRAGGWGPWGG